MSLTPCTNFTIESQYARDFYHSLPLQQECIVKDIITDFSESVIKNPNYNIENHGGYGQSLLTYLIKCNDGSDSQYKLIDHVITVYGKSLVNKGDHLGKTPLMDAVNQGQINVIERLIQAGADVNIHQKPKKDATDSLREFPSTALEMAAQKSDKKIVCLLLQNKATFFERNKQNTNYIYEIAVQKDVTCREYFKGADGTFGSMYSVEYRKEDKWASIEASMKFLADVAQEKPQ